MPIAGADPQPEATFRLPDDLGDIRGEWPLGSGENYIGDCIPLIGVEFINTVNDTLQSVVISRGPRRGQIDEKHPSGYFWGWNPVPGFRNPNVKGVAMSNLPETWPIEGWNDPIARFWKDENGKTQWFGYFGRGIQNADQESFFEADDDWDDEFNGNFRPDTTNLSRNGMALRMRQRGLQWSSFLAEDAIFSLYEINNDGTERAGLPRDREHGDQRLPGRWRGCANPPAQSRHGPLLCEGPGPKQLPVLRKRQRGVASVREAERTACVRACEFETLFRGKASGGRRQAASVPHSKREKPRYTGLFVERVA